MSLLRGVLRFALWTLLIVIAAAAVALAACRWQATQREVLDAAATAPATGRYVRTADAEIFIQEAGPPDGPTVLLVHGTGAWSETWRASMSVLANAGFRAIAIDLPPFGYSSRPDPPRYDKTEQGKRIVGVLDALQIPRAILVGHSFGGGPTVEATLAAPSRVQALVLVDAALAVRASSTAAEPASPLVGGLLAVRPLRDAVVATFLTNPLFTRKLIELFIHDPAHATDERVRVYQRPLALKDSTTAISAWLPALLAPASAASEDPASYGKLAMPVFLIWGERDTITPLGQARQLAAITPRVQLLVMEGVGHIPQIENPSEFNSLLLKCVAAVKADR